MTSIELNEKEIKTLFENGEVYIRANITVYLALDLNGQGAPELYVNFKGDERKPLGMTLDV